MLYLLSGDIIQLLRNDTEHHHRHMPVGKADEVAGMIKYCIMEVSAEHHMLMHTSGEYERGILRVGDLTKLACVIDPNNDLHFDR